MKSFQNVLTLVSFGCLILISTLSARAQIATESALALNGTNGYVQVPGAAWFNGNFTVEAWVYVRSYNNWSRLIDFADGPNTNNVYVALTYGSSGTPAMGVFTVNNSSPVITSPTQLPTNQWAHLAATMNGTTGTIYINGNVVVSGTLNVAPNVIRTNNYIGRSNYAADSYANAIFDEIRIWNVARSQTQIQTNMNQRVAGTEAGLVGYWRCDDGSGTTLTNRSTSPSISNGTLVGGATWTNSTAPIAAPYSLGLTNILEGPSAGTDSVVLAISPVNGPWTATANTSWLHLAHANGNGSTNLVFYFDANSALTRTGTLTLGTQTFTVTQAGATYVTAPAPLTALVNSGLTNPTSMALDGAGNVYISDFNSDAIKEWVAASNTVTSLVTTGLDGVYFLKADNAGNVYYPDEIDNTIRKWTATNNTVTTLIASGLTSPTGIAIDSAGNLYISDYVDNTVKKWTAANNSVSTLISNGLTRPFGIAVDAAGNLYIAEYNNNDLVKWTAANNTLSPLIVSNATLRLDTPTGVTVDGSGNVYLVTATLNNIIKWTAANNTISLLNAFGAPYDIAVDSMGNYYFANDNLNLIGEQPHAFVDPTTKVETAAAGHDALPAVLPTTENLLTPFAPTSDQSWLTFTGATNGVVSFAFTANTVTSARTAHLTVLGQTIPIMQNGFVSVLPFSLTTHLLSNGSLQFSFTNNSSATFTVLTTTNLSLPLANWTVLGAATNISGTLFQFSLQPILNTQQRYYRVTSP